MRLTFLLVLTGIIAGCGNTVSYDEIPFDTITDINGNSTQNLVKNGDFEQWTNSKPIGWKWNSLLGFSSAFTKSDTANTGVYSILFDIESPGSHTLYQTIPVEPNTFYVLTCDVKYQNNNWSYGGLSVEDENGEILGEHLYTKGNSNDYRQLGIKFNSKSNSTIKVIIGYRDRIDARAFYDNLKLFKSDGISNMFDSDFANTLNASLKLSGFDSSNYNSNIQKICHFINQTYIVSSNRFRSGNDLEKGMIKAERDSLKSFVKPFFQGSYFIGYLDDPITKNSAYCQKSSLSVSDILYTFNVPTRQIHMQENGSGFHQFFEYWHPYYQDWIIMDPYYGVNYINTSKKYIGYDGLVSEQTNFGLSEKNLVKLEMDAPFNVDELLEKGWVSELHSHILGDKRLSIAF